MFCQLIDVTKDSTNPHLVQNSLQLTLYLFAFLLPTPTLTNQMIANLRAGKLPQFLESSDLQLLEAVETQTPCIPERPQVLNQAAMLGLPMGLQKELADHEESFFGCQTCFFQHFIQSIIKHQAAQSGVHIRSHEASQDASASDQALQCFDFSTMELSGRRGEGLLEAESNDQRYLASVCKVAQSLIPMLEGILDSDKRQRSEPSSLLGTRQQTRDQRPAQPWAAQKYLAVKIICKIAPFLGFPETGNGWTEFSTMKTKLAQYATKQVGTLLNSAHAEDRAAGLNVLSSLCNLDIAINLEDLSELQVSPQTQQALQVGRHDLQAYLCSLSSIRETIFSVRGAAISIGVWQDVFAVLDGAKSSNAEPITREAASILIQLAAPRDSIYHFIKLAHEQSHGQKLQVRERVEVDGFGELLDQISPGG